MQLRFNNRLNEQQIKPLHVNKTKRKTATLNTNGKNHIIEKECRRKYRRKTLKRVISEKHQIITANQSIGLQKRKPALKNQLIYSYFHSNSISHLAF